MQGPTEIDPHSQVDMGLSDADIADITQAWLDTFALAQASHNPVYCAMRGGGGAAAFHVSTSLLQKAILAAGGYTWSLIPGQSNANAMPMLTGPDAKSCQASMLEACSDSSPWKDAPLLFGFHTGAQSGCHVALQRHVATLRSVFSILQGTPPLLFPTRSRTLRRSSSCEDRMRGSGGANGAWYGRRMRTDLAFLSLPR